MSGSSSTKIEKLIRSLTSWYGEIEWWPGYADEVMIGAILTQQTRWENVERALALLKKRDLCTIDAIMKADIRDIEDANPVHRILPDQGSASEITCHTRNPDIWVCR